jgi:hypothetical protein
MKSTYLFDPVSPTSANFSPREENDLQDISWAVILGQVGNNNIGSCTNTRRQLVATVVPASGDKARSITKENISPNPAIRRLLSALALASVTALAACNAFGVDLADKFQAIETGDARSTVAVKMSVDPVGREAATVLGFSYERLEYVDARNKYVVVLIAGVTTAKFTQPKR